MALALMKDLEGEILTAIDGLAGPQDNLDWLQGQTVDPHQFLGLELNPRAAAIAELVDLARLSAMALPHEGQRAVRADPSRFPEHQGNERRADMGRLASPESGDARRQARSCLS